MTLETRKKKVFILVGPTASGKTGLSIELAEHLPLEIVNSDSLQVFRHMDIGTSKPSASLQKKIPHHLIDILDPDQNFSAKDFVELCQKAIDTIDRQNKIPLIVGGAGFYLKALVHPTQDLPSGRLEITDPQKAYAHLVALDPNCAQKIHPNDHYRISRALFLLEQGYKPSDLFNAPLSHPCFDFYWLGIHTERSQLHTRISNRVEQMFEQGLVEETADVLQRFPGSKPRLARSIGYAQGLRLIQEEISRDQAKEEVVIQTRQYAKRQMTWFRGVSGIHWQPLGKAKDQFSLTIKQAIHV